VEHIPDKTVADDDQVHHESDVVFVETSLDKEEDNQDGQDDQYWIVERIEQERSQEEK
jgi:hypothetical protein